MAKVTCRITNEKIEKDLAIKGYDGRFYTASLYDDFIDKKNRKDAIVCSFKKMIGSSPRMPIPLVNKSVNEFVEWYSLEALEIVFENNYQVKGTSTDHRIAYMKAIIRNNIIKAQEEAELRRSAKVVQTQADRILDNMDVAIPTPVEIEIPVPVKKKRNRMFTMR